MSEKKRDILDLIRDPKTVKAMQSVATKHLTAERLLTIVINSIAKTPKLAQCSPQSVLGAAMTAQALGLEPNTPLQHCFLIPYTRRYKEGNAWKSMVECQFQIGYRGFIALAERSPKFVELQAEAIHDGDTFEHQIGSESFLRYTKALRDRGPLIGSFMYVRYRGEHGEGQQAVVLPLDEILKIREKSETFRTLRAAIANAEHDKDRAAAQKKYDETPWVLWEDQMAVKSAIKRGLQLVSLSPAVALAAEVDSASETGNLNLSALTDPNLLRAAIEGEASLPAAQSERPAIEQPKAKSERARIPAVLSSDQLTALNVERQSAGITEKELCELMNINSMLEIDLARYQEALSLCGVKPNAEV